VFIMEWAVDATDITFTVTGRTLGYVAVGISHVADVYAHVKMDAILAMCVKNKSSITDLWVPSYAQPTVDAASHSKGVRACTEVDGVTTVTFSRPLVAVDTTQSHTIVNGDMLVSWAIGEADAIVQHTNAGKFTVNLAPAAGDETTAPEPEPEPTPEPVPLPATTRTYTHCAVLLESPNVAMTLRWAVSDDGASVHMALASKSVGGWMGLVLSSAASGGVADAFASGHPVGQQDLVVVAALQQQVYDASLNGRVFAQDRADVNTTRASDVVADSV
jgi:hypothetical protein